MKLLAFIFVLLLATFSAHAEMQVSYSDADLSQIANRKYASGELPLGDNHFTLNSPRKGYIDLCHQMGDAKGGGAGRDGPWIHGGTWNIDQKLSVAGNVHWDGSFSNSVNDTTRELSGNGLPTNHTTGVFPIEASDPVSLYDRNPSSIHAQSVHEKLPAHPVYNATPNCMGMEVGYMLSGVALFNGFDAGLRDAAAHEAQDSCQGHPQQAGTYHYHSLSNCLGDISVKKVIGYALDGFPITGPMVTPSTYLTTDELDICHGITSEIVEDGVVKTTYHYVMTVDFPYSVSCFRGTPTRTGPPHPSPQQRGPGQTQKPNGPPPPPDGGPNGMRRPPKEAIDACLSGGESSGCGFTTPHGDLIMGTCQAPQGNLLICIPMQ